VAVLLLQGPLGSFFENFASRLEESGQTIFKINFNGGDCLFSSSSNSYNYLSSLDDWPGFLESFIACHGISQVFVYGDCRAYHQIAKVVCLKTGTRYHAFEEGYLRPNYITLEEGGVNGHSPIQRRMIELYEPAHNPLNEAEVDGNFSTRAIVGALYYISGLLLALRFKDYHHHRSFNLFSEGFCWLRAGFRKQLYRASELTKFKQIEKQPFFLIPLQVHNDAQIEHHSKFESIEAFITEVLASYKESSIDAALVIKHHPMDRGHSHYGKFIHAEAVRFGLVGKVYYVHDLHLPSLLKACEGVVTINSTTALQAFYHGASVKVLGNAFFDMRGLTDTQALNGFWQAPEPLDTVFADRFKSYLLDHGQINGSFYGNQKLTLDNLMAHLIEKNIIYKPVVVEAQQSAQSTLVQDIAVELAG